MNQAWSLFNRHSICTFTAATKLIQPDEFEDYCYDNDNADDVKDVVAHTRQSNLIPAVRVCMPGMIG